MHTHQTACARLFCMTESGMWFIRISGLEWACWVCPCCACKFFQRIDSRWPATESPLLNPNRGLVLRLRLGLALGLELGARLALGVGQGLGLWSGGSGLVLGKGLVYRTVIPVFGLIWIFSFARSVAIHIGDNSCRASHVHSVSFKECCTFPLLM